MERQLANELIDFLYESPTAYHAASSVKEILKRDGFVELFECKIKYRSIWWTNT
ncbi:hypothetical protein [Clostridium baratii]|uniref:hypothetical protein n=1 Tax=Clostridium baratii TaxID=1561 RepID=UPI003C6C0547